MRAAFIDCLLKAVRQVFTELGLDITAISEEKAHRGPVHVIATIGITGAVTGSLILRLPSERMGAAVSSRSSLRLVISIPGAR